MLITDFLPLNFPKRNLIVKGFERYSVEDFLNHFKSLANGGGKINVAYQHAIDFINENLQASPSNDNHDQESEEPLSEIEQKLAKIPVSELKLYYRKKSLDGILPKLFTIGISTIADLYRKPIGLSRKNDIELGNILKNFVLENYNTLISDWEESSQIIELPTRPSNNLVVDALTEMAQLAFNRQNQLRQWKGIDEKWNWLMQLAFIEGDCVREIQNKMGFSSFERPRQILMDNILKPFLAGNILFENLKLRQDVVERLKQIKPNFLFKQESLATEFLGGKISEDIAKVIGVDFVNITDDVRFIIPIDSKRLYNDVVKTTFVELRNAIEFKEPQILFEKIINNKDLSKKSFDSQIINNLLACEAIVNINDKGIQIHETLLGSNEQRLSRIIYDVNEPISREKVLEIYKAKYNTDITTGLNILDKYGIKNTKSNLWEYVGDSINSVTKLAPTEQKVAEYASTNKCFHFDKLIKWLTDQGYVITSNASIRTYITRVCTPSNQDRNIFCHKDFTAEYPQYTWREVSRDGLSNWILNQLNTMFEQPETESLEISEVVNHIEQLSIGTEYNYHIRQRVKSVLTTYSGEDNPFIIDDDRILRNSIVYPNIDFKIIGFRSKNIPYYSQIRALASNTLKHTEDGRLPLVDFIKIVNKSGFEKTINRKTIIDAIETTRLPNCNVILKTDNNVKYLEHLCPIISEETSTEPNYIVVPSQNDVDAAEVIENNQYAERSNVTYRQPIDWEKLKHALNIELKFYDSWLQNECECGISQGVDTLISFIKESSNSNLSQTLPRNLFEYWYAHIDNYDRCTYLTNISIFYEALLSDILLRKGHNFVKNGLGEIATYFPYFKNALSIDIRDAKGFSRIFKTLLYQRNKYAHGNAVELSSRGIAQYIADFIALYVFTLLKYA